MRQMLSCVLATALAACGAPATETTRPVAAPRAEQEIRDEPAPASAPPALSLPDCWTSDVAPADADARARLEAIAGYFAAQVRSAETAEIEQIAVVTAHSARELGATHALVTQMPLDVSSWRCARIRSMEDIEVRAGPAAFQRVTLTFDDDEPIVLEVGADIGLARDGFGWHERSSSLVRELLIRTLGPALATWQAAHPELRHASRIPLGDALDWTAITTDVDATQCLREHDGDHVTRQHCWRAPRHEGFLPAMGVGLHFSLSRLPDGGVRLRDLTVENEPQVVWEIQLPEETYAVVTRGRAGTPHPLALVDPPALGAMAPLLVEWHDRVRRIRTPFGEASCGTRDGRFLCVYPEPLP